MNNDNQINDSNQINMLLKRAKTGDLDSHLELLETEFLWNYLRKELRKSWRKYEDEFEDFIQTTLLNAFIDIQNRKKININPEKKEFGFFGWITKVLHSVVIKHHKKMEKVINVSLNE